MRERVGVGGMGRRGRGVVVERGWWGCWVNCGRLGRGWVCDGRFLSLEMSAWRQYRAAVGMLIVGAEVMVVSARGRVGRVGREEIVGAARITAKFRTPLGVPRAMLGCGDGDQGGSFEATVSGVGGACSGRAGLSIGGVGGVVSLSDRKSTIY